MGEKLDCYNNSVLKFDTMSSFQPLEVVNRGSETQLQVAENLDYYYIAL